MTLDEVPPGQVPTRMTPMASSGERRNSLVSRNARRGVVVRKGTAAVLKKSSPNPELTDAVSPNSVTWATHQFHFYNTPLHDVLTDLSDYYHVSLSCNNEDIRLTGDFQTEKLDMIIEMIEQSLNVNITCEKKRR